MGIIQHKKVIGVAAAATLLLFVCLSVVLAVNSIALGKAKDAASPHLSGTAEFVSYHNSVDRIILRYFDAMNQERIEIEVSKSTHKVIKMQSQKTGYIFSDGAALDDAALQRMFLNQMKGTSVRNIHIARSGDLQYAEITYTSSDSRGSYLMDPADGTLISFTVKFGSPVVIPYSPTGNNLKILKLSELKRIADFKVPGSVFQDIDIVYADAKFIAEIDLYKNGTKHILIFDASTGKELRHESYKDNWQSHGIWEAVELISPLISITNLDASLTQSDSESSTLSVQDGSSISGSFTSEAASTDSADSSYSAGSASGSSAATPPASSTPFSAASSATSSISSVSPVSGPEVTPTPTGPVIISILRVKELVLSRLPGAVFTDSIHLDTDDDRLLYEGKARSGAVEVSFEIDAYTGTFAKWETDTVGDD